MKQNLGKVGIVDKGIFDINKIYNQCDFVYHKGSTWLALKNDLVGIEPTESENWKYLARGFESELLNTITAIDTSGLLGIVGATTDTQTLIDAILKEISNNKIEYMYEGNILEIFKIRSKSFRFVVYNDTGIRGNENSIFGLPPCSYDTGTNIWVGEFLNLDEIMYCISRPIGMELVLKISNLAGDSFLAIGMIDEDDENGNIVSAFWSDWKQITGLQIIYEEKDVHSLKPGTYYVLNGVNMPSGCREARIEVYNNRSYKSMLCIDGENMYIKKEKDYPRKWGEWKCISAENTKAVYVGEVAPTDNSNIWMW